MARRFLLPAPPLSRRHPRGTPVSDGMTVKQMFDMTADLLSAGSNPTGTTALGGSLPCPVYFVSHRYQNHAGPSGYDRFADYLGESVTAPRWLDHLGRSVLRPMTKLVEWYNGSFEYSRHDCLREIATRLHMSGRQDAIYHFLYAEKSLRYLGPMNRRGGLRIIGSFHHCAFKYPTYFRSTEHFRAIEHAVVVSRIQIEHMESIVGPGKVSFVPYAVDASYFVPGERVSNRPLRCTCVGQHLRDFENLPAIIKALLSAERDLEFYVVGAPSKVRQSVEFDRVVWKQGISDAEYLDVLQQTDVLVLPLIDSTSVTTVNEALGCGVPIVTNRGGVSDYLNDACSIELTTGDVAGMVDATLALLRDDRRRQAMGLAARQQGLELDWSRSAAKMADVYRQVYDGMPRSESRGH